MEELARDGLIWVANTYPIAGAILMIIVVSYTAIKSIVALTPTEEDNKFLARFQKTWVGKVLEFVVRIPFRKK